MQMTPPPTFRSLRSNGGLPPTRDPGDFNPKSFGSRQDKARHSPCAASQKYATACHIAGAGKHGRPMQGTPVSRDPATPSNHPFEAQESLPRST